MPDTYYRQRGPRAPFSAYRFTGNQEAYLRLPRLFYAPQDSHMQESGIVSMAHALAARAVYVRSENRKVVTVTNHRVRRGHYVRVLRGRDRRSQQHLGKFGKVFWVGRSRYDDTGRAGIHLFEERDRSGQSPILRDNGRRSEGVFLPKDNLEIVSWEEVCLWHDSHRLAIGRDIVDLRETGDVFSPRNRATAIKVMHQITRCDNIGPANIRTNLALPPSAIYGEAVRLWTYFWNNEEEHFAVNQNTQGWSDDDIAITEEIEREIYA